MLYPTELLRHFYDLFNFHCSKESNNLPLRRRPLYPTELRGIIQKIFNFTGLQDSNDSIFRSRFRLLFLIVNAARKPLISLVFPFSHHSTFAVFFC